MYKLKQIYKIFSKLNRTGNKYTMSIRGENLKIVIDGQVCKLGFFTTRYIKAINEFEAKRIAIKLIKKEVGPVIKNDNDDPPIYIFENVMINENIGDHEVPGAGFTWFEENNN